MQPETLVGDTVLVVECKQNDTQDTLPLYGHGTITCVIDNKLIRGIVMKKLKACMYPN